MKYIVAVVFIFFYLNNYAQSFYYISDCFEERIMEFDDNGNYVNDVNGFYEYTSDIEIDDSHDIIYYPGISHPLPNYMGSQTTHTYNGNIVEFALDEINQKVYFWSQSLSSIEVIDYANTNQNSIVTTNGVFITGLEFDMIGQVIYYTHGNTLSSYNLTTGATQTIITGAANLIGLTIDFPNSKIYYLETPTNTTIQSCNLDGSNQQLLLSLNGVAVDLEIDYAKQRLVWFSDASNNSPNVGYGGIESCDYDGNNRSWVAVDVSLSPCPGGIAARTVGCDVNLVLNNPELNNTINYITANLIYSTSIITSGSTIHYDSNCIVLENGFECEGALTAQINPCSY